MALIFAQNVCADVADTVIALDPVFAKGVKFDQYALGAKIVPIDSFQMAVNPMSSAAEILSFQSIANVTSYGPGGQAGIKLRGGGSDHTTIIWNGLNLKPPMSGELNYSAVAAGVVDGIKIQPGGSNTMYGSGASTGIVFLTNNLDISKKGLIAGLSLEGGSFESYGLNSEIGYVFKNFGTRLLVSYQETENNFKYVAEKIGKPIEIQEHAAFNTFSVLQQNAFQLGTNTKLETDFWYSNHFKKIPSLSSKSEPGKTEQGDENTRIAINLGHYGSNWFVKYRGGYLAYLNDYLGYDTAYYSAVNQSSTLINELESKYRISNVQAVFLGVNHTFDKVKSSSYNEDAMRNQLDLFGRYSLGLFENSLQLNLEGRQAICDGSILPFVYSLGIQYAFFDQFSLKSLVAKLYSLPDLNDLYWLETAYESGNPDLRPEYGWSYEAGILHEYKNKRISLSHELTIYQSVLEDPIVWLQDSTDKWVPNNHKGTITKGFEFIGQTQLFFHRSAIKLGYDYAYTDAKISDEVNGNTQTYQRRYIPKHKIGFRVQYLIKDFSIGIYSQFVGKRFIDAVSLPLDSYVLVDIYGSYKFKIKSTSIIAYAKAKNILNTDYQIMSGYAQPSRGFYIGINIKL